MSTFTVRGNSLGTGTIILETPNTNTNRTITLPDATGTLVVSGGTESITVTGTGSISVTGSGGISATGGGNISVSSTGGIVSSGSGNITSSGSGNITSSGTGSITATGSGGVGYGTGAGGTVSQLTNKSTSVTLNKLTGQITMKDTSLAAQSNVSFVMNNSLVTAADVIIANIGNSATPANYNLSAVCSSGSVTFTLRNLNGSTALAEAITINFVIIKGATA